MRSQDWSVVDSTEFWQQQSLQYHINAYSSDKHLLNLIYVVLSLAKTDMDIL
jgi:hypothetical protein